MSTNQPVYAIPQWAKDAAIQLHAQAWHGLTYDSMVAQSAAIIARHAPAPVQEQSPAATVREVLEAARRELAQARQKYQDGFDNVPFCELAGAMERLLAALSATAPASATAPQSTEGSGSRPDGFVESLVKFPADLHPATRKLVKNFAAALADKLAKAEKKYGYSDGWQAVDWIEDGQCRDRLMEHVYKGDPRDVAAYCAFLWYHKAKTTPDAMTQPMADLRTELRWQLSTLATISAYVPESAKVDREYIAGRLERGSVLLGENFHIADALAPQSAAEPCKKTEGEAVETHEWAHRATAEYARIYLGDSSPEHIALERHRMYNVMVQFGPHPAQLTKRELALTKERDELRELLAEEKERAIILRDMLATPPPTEPSAKAGQPSDTEGKR